MIESPRPFTSVFRIAGLPVTNSLNLHRDLPAEVWHDHLSNGSVINDSDSHLSPTPLIDKVSVDLIWRQVTCHRDSSNTVTLLEGNVALTPLLADLERASDLLQQVDENRLEFGPDPNVSDDIRELTGVETYPVDSHLANLRARIEAVAKAGSKLDPRDPSDYVSRLIVACVRLAPPSDD